MDFSKKESIKITIDGDGPALRKMAWYMIKRLFMVYIAIGDSIVLEFGKQQGYKNVRVFLESE